MYNALFGCCQPFWLTNVSIFIRWLRWRWHFFVNENVVFMFVYVWLCAQPYLRKTFNENFICLFSTKNYFCFVLIINNFENNRIITYLIRMRIANITTCALTFGVVRFSLSNGSKWGGCRLPGAVEPSSFSSIRCITAKASAFILGVIHNVHKYEMVHATENTVFWGWAELQGDDVDLPPALSTNFN